MAETDTAFAHVQLQARFGKLGFKPFELIHVRIKVHEIEGDVSLLGSQAGKRERLLGIAMVSIGIKGMRNEVSNHSVLHPFLELRIQVLANNLANGLQRLASLFGKFLEIGLDRQCFALHKTPLVLENETVPEHRHESKNKAWP